MARLLSETYLAAMAAPVRRPLLSVEADPHGEEYQVTPDIIAWSVSRTREHRAGNGTLLLANPGVWAERLTPGTRVKVRLGLRTEIGMELIPIFTGVVEQSDVSMARGEADTLRVQLFDLAAPALHNDITTPSYAPMQANVLLQTLFTTYGGISPEEMALFELNYLAPATQFVQESLLDAGFQVAQAARCWLGFDAEGMLRTNPLLPQTTTPQWTCVSSEVRRLREWRQAPAYTRVIVTGRVQEPVREVGQEVLWAEAQLSDYEWQAMLRIPFTPAGAVYEDVRIQSVTQLSQYEQMSLYAIDRDGITVKVISPSGRDVHFLCYGKQVFYTTPQVMVVVQLPELTEIFGERLEEISNPLIVDEMAALALAQARLNLARWGQRQVSLALLANPALDPGDVIAVTHPLTGESLLILAHTVTHAGHVGRDESTTVEGWVMEV